MKPLILFIALLCQFAARTQTLNPAVMAAAGSTQTAVSGNAILTFTAGETAILTLNQPGTSYGQGFHNGCILIVATENLDLEAWQLRVFPNPVKEALSVQFLGQEVDVDLEASVWNMLGQCLSQPVTLEKAGLQTFDVSHLSPGAYLLQITDLSGRNKSIPFIKI